jgi:hypothetical protein
MTRCFQLKAQCAPGRCSCSSYPRRFNSRLAIPLKTAAQGTQGGGRCNRECVPLQALMYERAKTQSPTRFIAERGIFVFNDTEKNRKRCACI